VTKQNTKQVLDGSWIVSQAAGTAPIELPSLVPATVPGSIHTDLLAAGLIPDPFLDDNERLLAWIGYCDWDYQTEFEWQENNHSFTELVFEGLDTVAAIYLNGKLLGEVANQHRSYRFDVKNSIISGRNRLQVRFSSAIRYADRMSLQYGYRPHVNHHPYNAIRKMAANFGWDWGIDTSTVGIWKSVYLESYDFRISAVRPTLTVHGETGRASIEIELAGVMADNQSQTLSLKLADQFVEIENPEPGINKLELTVTNPRLWSTHSEGEPNLYPLEVALETSKELVDKFRSNVGFRNISVKYPVDPDGMGFEFHLNDQPIFVRGVNWIANDAFLHRVTKASLRERLTQAKKANINLIRVWGGGIYESEDFYELCDELGLLVWQDFLFACASYSEEDLGAEVEAEARQNITRIMKHPSLALWNGNNENLWGYQEWNWAQRLEGKSWGAGFYFELLPRLVQELDPARPYTPGSPFSPDPEKPHNDQSAGSVHIWDLWNQKDYPHYLDYEPRFVAEFGWQGPANWATIKQSITDDPLTPESPGMIIHQKAINGNDKLTDGLVNHFALPSQMEDWHWAMQLNQANAIRCGLEHMRNQFPRCMGAIVWQLNDCWPVTSWAAIDGAGREKPMYFSIAQSYQPLLVTISNSKDSLQVNLLNNELQEAVGSLKLTLTSFDGEKLAEHEQAASVAPNSKEVIQIPQNLLVSEIESASCLVASFAGKRAIWFFVDYKHSKLTSAAMDIELATTTNGFQLKIEARNLIRDLLVMIDKLDPDASIDKGLITLLPGESALFEIQSKAKLTLEQFIPGRVIRTANELVAI
jgi:beta-mannosidase